MAGCGVPEDGAVGRDERLAAIAGRSNDEAIGRVGVEAARQAHAVYRLRGERRRRPPRSARAYRRRSPRRVPVRRIGCRPEGVVIVQDRAPHRPDERWTLAGCGGRRQHHHRSAAVGNRHRFSVPSHLLDDAETRRLELSRPDGLRHLLPRCTPNVHLKCTEWMATPQAWSRATRTVGSTAPHPEGSKPMPRPVREIWITSRHGDGVTSGAQRS